MLFKRIWFFLFCISLFSSCVKDTEPAKPEIQKTIDLSEKEEDAYQTKLFAKGFWPDKNWWEFFGDEQLSSFIETALKDNPSLKSAQEKILQANQEAYIVRSKLLPQLGALFNFFGAHFSKQLLHQLGVTLSPNLHFYNLSLDFDYEFDFWGKNRLQFEAALGEVKVKEAMFEETKLILSTAIAREYFDLQANLMRMEILQEILANRIKMLDLYSLRKANRIDNLIDLNGMKEEVVSFQKIIVTLKEDLDLQKSMLITLMGQNPGGDLMPLAMWKKEKLRFELPSEIGMNLLARRPDLTSQIWTLVKASKNVGVAIRNFLPNVDLKAFGGVQSVDFGRLFKEDSLMGGVIPLIRLPIFEGGRLRAFYRARVKEYESLVYEYNDLLLKAANEVVSGITRFTAVNAKLNYQLENVALAKQNYELIYVRYRHGVDSMLAPLVANEKFLMERLSEIELEKARYFTMISLIKALGGGFFNESVEKEVP